MLAKKPIWIWDQCCSCGNWPTIVQVAIAVSNGKVFGARKILACTGQQLIPDPTTSILGGNHYLLDLGSVSCGHTSSIRNRTDPWSMLLVAVKLQLKVVKSMDLGSGWVSTLRKRTDLIPDPLGWHTCNKSIDALMDLGSDVVAVGIDPL